MGWAIVPIVTVVAFTFMGIEGIAEEIEMPFGELNGSRIFEE
jgi:putative membrane protein